MIKEIFLKLQIRIIFSVLQLVIQAICFLIIVIAIYLNLQVIYLEIKDHQLLLLWLQTFSLKEPHQRQDSKNLVFLIIKIISLTIKAHLAITHKKVKIKKRTMVQLKLKKLLIQVYQLVHINISKHKYYLKSQL